MKAYPTLHRHAEQVRQTSHCTTQNIGFVLTSIQLYSLYYFLHMAFEKYKKKSKKYQPFGNDHYGFHVMHYIAPSSDMATLAHMLLNLVN
jgi:hypothetical protein